ncbi:MAG: polyprenyl synthetase family protein [Frankia sp.]
MAGHPAKSPPHAVPRARRQPVRDDLGGRVRDAASAFVDARARELNAIDPALASLTDAAADLVRSGGKRLRPAFCYWGWRGAGGAEDGPEADAAVVAAASLELLHACALVQDDVMDGAATRRGRPAAHRRLAAAHREAGWVGDQVTFGTSSAVLLGDLLLVWADEMLAASGLSDAAIRRAWPVYSRMRAELICGQYLDLVGQVSETLDLAAAMQVARYKSAKYTVERALHLGGVLAGADPPLLEAYSGFGLPIGEAFQLRDDVLGVFGDPAVTGKPAGDDLREGKRTALIALTHANTDAAGRQVLRRLLGNPLLDADGVEQLRTVIVTAGALAGVEEMISDRTRAALAALRDGPIDAGARESLTELAVAATTRRR